MSQDAPTPRCIDPDCQRPRDRPHTPDCGLSFDEQFAERLPVKMAGGELPRD